MKPIQSLKFAPIALFAGVIALSATPIAHDDETRPELVALSSAFKPPLSPPLDLLGGFNPPDEKWLAGHRGVDLSAVAGSSVRSAGAGIIHFVGTVVDRPVISINHGALRTTYEPVESDLTPGQSVAAGQVIGIIASGGHCSERCLHWGLKRGEEYLNPLALLKIEPPVLKPPH